MERCFWKSNSEIKRKMSYVDYKAQKGTIPQKYYRAVDEGVEEFKKEQNVYKPISGDESRNNGCDVEASYLCHGIWTKVMKNSEKPMTGSYFKWKSGEVEMIFHFDIMNNPSIKGKKYSCGLFKELDAELGENVKAIYHTIGNMTPIPWFPLAGGSYIDGQKLHKSLDERWDLYLQVLKSNWKKWNPDPKGLSFERYMILTCQQVYYEEIYEDISKEGANTKNITVDTIRRWNDRITPDSKLISFSDPREDINKIISIIKMRCSIIRIMLE